MDTDDLTGRVDAVATESRLSGVVRVDIAGETVLERAYGWAHRAHRVPMTLDTRLGTASATKSLTALVVLGLADEDTLPLATPARELLGADLPLVDDRVTVEHLLAHRSGIGDYLDEDTAGAIDEHVLTVPVHTLATSEDYLAVLGGHPQAFAPDERFAYCNGGYAVLAILVERAAHRPFPDLLAERVGAPMGLVDTAFLRSDALPDRTALGYLDAEGDRTNVLHLPVRGTGDGGTSTTVADVHRLWAGIDPAVASVAWAPRSDVPEEAMRYGLGFWLHPTGPAVIQEGYDAGVSFRTVHDPVGGTTHTVISNWSDGAWPMARLLDDLVLGWRR